MPVDGFHDTLFPTRIGLSARSGKGWRTIVQQMDSGVELRVARWSQLKCRFGISFNNMELANIRTVEHFHAGRQGRRFTFRYLDPNDHRDDDQIGDSATLHTNAAFEASNGSTIFFTAVGGETTTQLTKPYGDTVNTIQRQITKPVDNSVFPSLTMDTGASPALTITIPAFTLYNDTGGGPVALTNGTEYTMPFDTGLIDWTVGSAPLGSLGAGDVLSWAGWFHVHARMDSDLPEIDSLLSYLDADRIDASAWPDLEIIEVRG